MPTPVSVAVTNSPRTPRLAAQAARSKSNGRARARAPARRSARTRLLAGARVGLDLGDDPLRRRRRHLRRVQPEVARDRAEHARGLVQLGGRVRGHRRQAQPRGAGRHRRRADRLREHAALDRLLAEAHRVALIAHDQRHDRACRCSGTGKPSLGQRAAQGARVGVQPLDPVRALLQQLERRERRRRPPAAAAPSRRSASARC